MISWKTVRRVLICLAAMITLIALFYAVENWRGYRAFAKYRGEAQAHGVVFDFRKFIPPPVPDEQNFAMTPLLRGLFESSQPEDPRRGRGTAGYQRAEQITPFAQGRPAKAPGIGGMSGWRRGKKTDLVAWQRYYQTSTNFAGPAQPDTAAQDVLANLAQFDSELEELRMASRRPYSRFDVHYETENVFGILLPHLAPLKAISQTLTLRASANLALGRADTAFEDIQLIFRLIDSIKEEPFIIVHLVRMAMFEIGVQPVWERLSERHLTERQLAALQERLAEFDFVRAFHRAMQSEQAAGNNMIEHVRRHPEIFNHLAEARPGENEWLKDLLVRLVPTGWFYFEQLNYNRAFDEFIISSFESETGRIRPAMMEENQRDLEKFISENGRLGALLNHRVLTGLLLPALANAAERAAAVQTTVVHAQLACALERYHLAYRQYPERLDALVPQFTKILPQDVITGWLPIYRRTDDGRFLLYSPGWNEIDDGGKTVFSESPGYRGVNWEQGDWVWPMAQ